MTYNPGLERWLYLSSLQFLPVDFSKEMVIGHGALSALCGHAAQPVGWVLGQELSQSKHGSISRKKTTLPVSEMSKCGV